MRPTLVLRRFLVLLCLGALFGAGPVAAQVIVTGTVTDAETGEPLPAATVQVEGTTTGTITNRAGAFTLRVVEPPAVLVVRFIGYTTGWVGVEATPGEQHLAVQLEPVSVVGEEVVITDENYAEVVMRRAVEAKQRWRADLETWQADAYTRQTVERDTAIVALVEGVTAAYWRRGDGVREVVRAVRRTANLDLASDALRAADTVINLYDDAVAFGGYTLVGPTAPEALRFYRFTLESIRYLDDRLVYDVALTPRNPLQPGFEGRVSILGDVWALVDAAVRPNDVVRFPGVNDLRVEIRQQFVGIEAFWLPADYRFDGVLEVGLPGLRFPAARFRRIVRLTDHVVNAPVPDTLFAARRRTVVDSAAVAAGAALDREGLIVPLEAREAEALARIDSTDRVEEAFQPTGPLARFVRVGTSDDPPEAEDGFAVRPVVRFNRVEALHVGAEAAVSMPGGSMLGGSALSGRLGYAAGLEAWTYEAALGHTARLGKRSRLDLRLAYACDHVPMANAFYPAELSSAATLLGERDYYDYYRRQGVEASVRLAGPFALTLDARFEDHGALPVTSGYDLFGRRDPQPNPDGAEGRLHAVGLRVAAGRDPEALTSRLLSAATGAAVRVEMAAPDVLGGDFGYRRLDGVVATRLPTGLRRRLLPLVLDLRLAGGVASEDLPIQRAFAVEGTVLGFAPAGVLRSLPGQRALGRRYVLATWEHDFRTVPFELLGAEALVRRSVALHVFGGHGRTWEPLGELPGTAGWRHEVGVGLSGGLLVPARLDVAFRLDAPGVFVTVGLPRLF